ncbi:restriction endonuclease subunit S, partial [Candidatus Bathyarchaeota archaeon]|nr:restriction endonuclease subunit S [Candidatus Bathyarchaeota archaeon]
MMFCKEDDFAETPIGDFPKDWRVVSLGDIAKVKGGKRVRKGEKLVDFRTGFPYIRVVDFKNGTVDVSRVKYLLPETHEKIKNYTISSNDVYISIAGTVGLAGLIPPELDGANLTENAAKLCDLKNVRKQFLACLLNSEVPRDQMMGLIGKGTQPKLALFRIESLKIPLPSMEEQEKIAEVLGVVDSAIWLVDRVIWKTERLKKGLMQELLTKGIGHKEYKDTQIGKTPNTWQIEELGEMCNQRSGIVQPSGEGANRFIGLEHIAPGEITVQSYGSDVDIRSSKFRFCPKDILYGK